jgi:nucleoside-diphosphate-sugar epimerase
MKKAVVIGGCGKVGSYLVPMLVRAGWEAVSVSRGQTEPYVKAEEWGRVQKVRLDRGSADFAPSIAALSPDVVVDMICFTQVDMLRLIDALRGRVQHYLVCGSMWMHGRSAQVPVREEECRDPMETYGVEKEKMDRAISREWAESRFPGTIFHPGHIVCPGDVPINPQGCKSLDAFRTLRAGEPLYLPNFGMETLHHVHAKDIAGLILAAINAGQPAFGEGFHAVSPRAVTLSGYAQEAASWYGKTADLRFEPYDTWKRRVSPEDAASALTHMLHSPSGSMEKAARLLRFAPAYTSYDAVRECLQSFGAL